MPKKVADGEVTSEVLRKWADTLYLERHRRRLKQVDVAAMAGVSQATLSETENGRGSFDSCMAIANALGIDLVGES